MKITDDNYKGISLEDFVDFDLEELYLLEDILNDVKNNKPIKVDSDQTEILSRIQAKVLILTVQP
jgi:uncharacterized protein YcbK (DUF882 family)|tara:strand:+ start:399 stop:593 length:195 start_codon:yes stop_codon:yes gene_type:complete